MFAVIASFSMDLLSNLVKHTRANAKIKLNTLTTKAEVGVITTKERGYTHKNRIKFLETPKGD